MGIQKPFVVRNGLEVANDGLVVQTGDLNVGVGTYTPQYDLDVLGDINYTGTFYRDGVPVEFGGGDTYWTINNVGVYTSSSVGVGTYIFLNANTGIISAKGININGVLLDSANERQVSRVIATQGQTNFSINYSVGYVDVFLNGSRLSSTEYTATDGYTVVLTDPATEGDEVQLIADRTFTITNIGSASGRNVQYFVATAGQTNFSATYTPGFVDVFLNGSKLSGLEFTATNGNTVILTTPASLGDEIEIVSFIMTDPNAIVANYWEKNSVGLNTSTYVGIGTTTPTSQLTVAGDVLVSGVVTATTFYGNLIGNADTATYATTSGIATLAQGLTGSPNLNVGIVTATTFYGDGSNLTGISAGGINYWEQNYSGINTSSFVGIGTTIPTSQLTVAGDVLVSGVVTATAFYGDGSNLTNLPISGGDSYWVKTNAGIHTFANVGFGTTNPTTALDVYGNLAFSDKNIKIGDSTVGQNLVPDSQTYIVSFTWTGATTLAGEANNAYYPSGLSGSLNGTNLSIYVYRDYSGAIAAITPDSPNPNGDFNFVLGEQILILGSLIGGVDSVDDITLTVKEVYNLGTNNVFLGFGSGQSTTDGFSNNFIGYKSGYYNTTGYNNNFFGTYSGYCNTTGCFNNFIGQKSGYYNTTGCYDNFIGHYAGYCNNYGESNNFIGRNAGYTNSTGSYNNFFGHQAGKCNTTGSDNFFIGCESGYYNTTGYDNTFIGRCSGSGNTTGYRNIFIGPLSGRCNVGNDNNFLGRCSGYNNTGSTNNFIGLGAGYDNSGSNNNFLGYYAGYNNTTGSYNIAIGDYTYGPTTGSGNFLGGYAAGYYGMTDSSYNNFIGWYSGGSSDQGYSCYNNFIGYFAGARNSDGCCNNFFGYYSGYCNNSGINNNFVGSFAGYYNGGDCNNFIGYNAGRYNSTGSCNTFIGCGAGYSNTTGSGNVSIGENTRGSTTGTGNFIGGYYAGYCALNDSSYNNFIGWYAAGYLDQGTSCHNNFIGSWAGAGNCNGYYNNFFGYYAGYSNNSSDNNFIGCYSGYSNTTGNYNNFLGSDSGRYNTSGYRNIFLGVESGYNNTTGYVNNFIGACAGYYNTSGIANNFIGELTGYSNTTGSWNVFIGQEVGYYNTSGSSNTAVGASYALQNNTTGWKNSAFGTGSGWYNTTGNYNLFFGNYSGYCNISGSYNIFFGNYTGRSTSASYKVIFGQGKSYNKVFDSPDTTKDKQFAVGLNTTGTSEYWLVGNENFNIGIGTTNPTAKLHIGGGINIGIGNTYITGDGDLASTGGIDGQFGIYNVSIGGSITFNTFNQSNVLNEVVSIRAGQSNFNSNIYSTGIITATSYYGDGSNLTGISAGIATYATTAGIATSLANTPISTSGITSGFTASSGIAVVDTSTFTGGIGTSAYNLNDIVYALKTVGILSI